MSRKRFDVVPKGEKWDVTSGGEVVSSHRTKQVAVDSAAQKGRGVERRGGEAQVVIHKQDGVIQSERTYGNDPKKTPG